MEIINQQLLDHFKLFFKNLKPEDNIALFHDTDPDGTTSGRLICETVKLLGCKVSLLITDHSHALTDKIIQQLKDNNINKLITTDKSVDEDIEQIKKVEKFAEICVFDHHVIQSDISSEKTVFLKAQLVFDTNQPSKYCSAKLTYDLLNMVVDLSYLDWLCVAGIIGDMASEMWEEFITKVFHKYDLERKTDLFETKIGLLTQLISFAEAMGEDKECMQAVLSSNELDELLIKLEKYQKVKDDVDYYFNNFEQLAEKYDHLYFLEIKSKYFIKTIVASKASNVKFPHDTLIVIQKNVKGYGVSGRRNDSKISMNELLKKAVDGLEGNAGGHVPASGASISLKDFPKFKENLLRIHAELIRI